MIQLPRRAVALPLIIHRRQHLEARPSLELLPDPATSRILFDGLSRRASGLYTNSSLRNYCKLCTVATVSRMCRHLKTVQRLRGAVSNSLFGNGATESDVGVLDLSHERSVSNCQCAQSVSRQSPKRHTNVLAR